MQQNKEMTSLMASRIIDNRIRLEMERLKVDYSTALEHVKQSRPELFRAWLSIIHKQKRG